MSDSLKTGKREFRNINITDLLRYRFPLAAIQSILHRASGAIIFLLLPFILFLLDKSLLSEISFEHFKGIASHWFVKLILLALGVGLSAPFLRRYPPFADGCARRRG